MAAQGSVVGEVVEAFEPAAGTSSFEEKWWTCCCLCTFFARVTSETEPGFTLRFNSCCCGEHNNCCGATCCRPDLVIDVLDESGAVVSHVQKTFAPAGGDAARCPSYGARAPIYEGEVSVDDDDDGGGGDDRDSRGGDDDDNIQR